MMLHEDRRTFPITAQAVDEYSEHLVKAISQLGVRGRNAALVRITVEEALLCQWEHFGDGVEVTMTITNSLGAPHVRMEHVGEPYNPLADSNAAYDDFAGGSLFDALELRASYAYLGGRNILRFPLPRVGVNPTISLLVGLAAGAIVGVVGDLLLPESVQVVFLETIVDPLFDLWVRILNALAAPVIFFMVMSTMLAMRKVESRGGSSTHVIARYFLLSFVVGAIAVLAAINVFGLSMGMDELGRQDVSRLIADMTNIIPKNVIDPFVTSNTPQLMVVAFALAHALMVLGERTRNLARLVQQVNMATSLVTNWVSRLAPLFAGVLLAFEIWGEKENLLVGMWRPLAIGLVLSALFFLLEVTVAWVRLGITPWLFVKKVREPFVTAVRTGTLDAAYADVQHSCVQRLGIDATLTDLILPQGLVLYMPASIIGTLAFTISAAADLNVGITPLWCVMAVVLDVLLFVATPSVPGANVLAFIALFQQLSMPQEALLVAMIFDIVFGLFANGANQALLQVEMLRLADRLGELDRNVLVQEA